MIIQAIGLLLISSVFMGIMSILRKEYQERNSISLMPTVLFLIGVSIIGAGVSVAAGHGLHISGLSLISQRTYQTEYRCYKFQIRQ